MPTDPAPLLQQIFQPAGGAVDLLAQWALWRQALATPGQAANPALRLALHTRLASGLAQSQHPARAEHLDEALAHYQAALALSTKGDNPACWAALQGNLAFVYIDRVQGDPADNLERAIAHGEAALTVYRRRAHAGPWATVHTTLAAAFEARALGDPAQNLEQALAHHRLALSAQTRQAAPTLWAEGQSNLAVLYGKRIAGSRSDNLERALRHAAQALTALSRRAQPPEWAQAHSVTASLLGDRLRGERSHNQEQAIEHIGQALRVHTRRAWPLDWARLQHNLAGLYRERVRGEPADNLERAIRHYALALQVRTRDAEPDAWARSHLMLGLAYSDRLRGPRARNIEAAIQHCELAGEVYTRGSHPQPWAATQAALSISHQQRITGERSAHIEQALLHAHNALQVYTRADQPEAWGRLQHNLGGQYFERVHGERDANLEQALAHYRHALEVRTLQGFPADFQLTQGSLGLVHFERGRWLQSVEACEQAVRAEELLLASAFTEAGRQSEVAQTAPLYPRAAYSLLKLGRPAEALEMLERGRARLLARALAHAAAGRRTTRREPTPPALGAAEILALLPPQAALVATLVTPHGSAVLVVPQGATAPRDEHVLWLPDLGEDGLMAMLAGPPTLRAWGGWMGAYLGAAKRPAAWLKALDEIGAWLWARLMGPIAQRLAGLGAKQVLLAAQGGLALLPLQAAWHLVGGQRRHFGDEYAVTSIASAQAQRVAQQRAQARLHEPPRLAAVVDPNADLPFAAPEAALLQQLFGRRRSRLLTGDAATPQAVRQLRGSHLHFACHGYWHWADPMSSALQLAGGVPLTLRQVLGELGLRRTRLVVLSACETGLTDQRKAPDESLGLPAAFLQAGAAAVVSTLWRVNDLSASLLMERFYQRHLQAGDELATALQQAQTWLREVSAGELALRFAHEEEAALAGRAALPLASASAYFARFASQPASHRPFAHPVHWAAFTLTGA